MTQIALMLATVLILALGWTVFSMKRDGYISSGQKNDSRKSGSIVFFKDSVRHIK